MPYSRHDTALATYACDPLESRSRLHPEPESDTRTCFQRDRDRILHSAAFRRLEYKTQVFVNHEGDHYRTRLTHSLEVSQMARALSRSLGLNEDLAETVALAHDLGHTPFGHAGEEGLHAAMQAWGGYDHNAQSIRIVTRLEQRYAEFNGLNLTWETLEGIAKHNGPVVQPPRALAEYNTTHDLELHTYASLEAQVAALSDDIAYNNHDIDDGMRAGLLTREMLEEVPDVAAVFRQVEAAYPGLELSRLVHEALRRLINHMCNDVLATTRRNIQQAGVKTVADVRSCGRQLVAFSQAQQEANRQLKAFLMEHMYRHYKVNRMSSKAGRVVQQLFAFFHADPACLPTEWRRRIEGADTQATAEVVGDYIAGMTDRYALKVWGEIFD